MSTNTGGISGGIVNAPPTRGAHSKVQSLTTDPLGQSKLNVVHEEPNRAGGRKLISDFDYAGGKVLLYEYVNSKQVGGLSVHEVTAASMIFIPAPQVKKSSKRK